MANYSTLLFFILLSLFMSGVSHAASAYPKDVLHLLRGFEWQPDDNKLRALPADTYRHLIEMAIDTELPPQYRPRALQLLTRYPVTPVWEFMQSQLAVADTVGKRRLIEALCEGFSGTRSDQLERELLPFLGSEDAHTRVIAARCLHGLESPTARAELAAYRQRLASQGASWELRALP